MWGLWIGASARQIAIALVESSCHQDFMQRACKHTLSGGRPSVAKPGLPELPLPGAAGALPAARFDCALEDGPGHHSSVVPDLSTASNLQAFKCRATVNVSMYMSTQSALRQLVFVECQPWCTDPTVTPRGLHNFFSLFLWFFSNMTLTCCI